MPTTKGRTPVAGLPIVDRDVYANSRNELSPYRRANTFLFDAQEAHRRAADLQQLDRTKEACERIDAAFGLRDFALWLAWDAIGDALVHKQSDAAVALCERIEAQAHAWEVELR